MNQIGVIQGIEHKIGLWSDRLTETETDLSAQEAIISSPFAKQAELEAKKQKEQMPKKIGDRIQWAKERSEEHNAQIKKNKTKYRGMEL